MHAQDQNQDRLAPVLYIPHGGGPLPLLGDPGHRELVDFLGALSAQLPVPEAILVVSAHWEEAAPTVTGAATPGLIYDYYGFPSESYAITYPAPGAPSLADEVRHLLSARGLSPRVDERRGFDHGVFVPLKLLFPSANIPVVQLSLLASLDPASHLDMGQALVPLRARNVLVLGSGLSFHNMAAFGARAPGPDPGNEAFEAWLVETCTDCSMDDGERRGRLARWETAPQARYCHPREEHLLPLHVCAGMSTRPAQLAFSGGVLGKRTSAFLWDR